MYAENATKVILFKAICGNGTVLGGFSSIKNGYDRNQIQYAILILKRMTLTGNEVISLIEKIENNEAITKTEKGGGEQKCNSCCNCREGFIMGKEVYCNLDGRFHPLYDNYECKSFVPKIRERRRAT